MEFSQLKVAYLCMSYPEISLSTVRREIEAVEDLSVEVVRFSNKKSQQPLLTADDRRESDKTYYLSSLDLSMFAIYRLVVGPVSFFRALGSSLRIDAPWWRRLGYFLRACKLQTLIDFKQCHHLHAHFAQSASATAYIAHSFKRLPWSFTVHGVEDLAASNSRNLSLFSESATRIIAISYYAADKVKRASKSGEKLAHVVRMGVNEDFLQNTLPPEAGGPIVCIARFQDGKGHHVLIDAISKIPSFKERHHRLVLVGDGPTRESIETLTENLGLKGVVDFLGWQSESRIAEIIDRSLFVVLPSFGEGLPVCLVEAFARARAVIATDVAGVPELVLHGSNGLLVPANDVDALRRAILCLLEMPPEELRLLGEAGHQRVLSEYCSATSAQQLVGIWTDLVTER